MALAPSRLEYAQAAAGAASGSALAFDAVVIKPDKSGSGSTRMSSRDSSFQGTNVSLKDLLINAYPVREARLIYGLPAWAESAHFDVTAKVVDPDVKVYDKLTREQRQAMLALMLEDRFHLKVHVETKTLPVYEMVVAKDGPKFQESVPSAADPDKPKPAFGPGSVNTGRGEYTANTVPLSSLAFYLSYALDRTVIDRTGLAGKYSLHLKFTPDDAAQPVPDDAPPPLFTALSEQLGLKLQAAKGPVETLVVDHVEPPTEN
jgi:uncharacterized protein (TIGR03435 family)